MRRSPRGGDSAARRRAARAPPATWRSLTRKSAPTSPMLRTVPTTSPVEVRPLRVLHGVPKPGFSPPGEYPPDGGEEEAVEGEESTAVVVEEEGKEEKGVVVEEEEEWLEVTDQDQARPPLMAGPPNHRPPQSRSSTCHLRARPPKSRVEGLLARRRTRRRRGRESPPRPPAPPSLSLAPHPTPQRCRRAQPRTEAGTLPPPTPQGPSHSHWATRRVAASLLGGVSNALPAAGDTDVPSTSRTNHLASAG